MLYPMYWQHVYIPVLPQHLIDYCCAPMPYLIGIHSSLMEKVRGMAVDDVVILNVDTNTLESPFDDLQNLPNDVVSSLKNRLKKVSTTTGDGVARAFLKAQAALFGSYRSALRIEPEEPITFNEDAFVTHRSSTMRQFLQNAIQLQLFKQFIDGRLELLNSGEGFSDVFEEEINMGEYAGSDKVYHQWLLTVKKGGGAIFNTVKTKANPAMKTVYKFAKDHARMGIREVKSRLKQKELAENGYPSSRDEPGSTHADSTHSKDMLTCEQGRPVTVHFGQLDRGPPQRPPPPIPSKLHRSTQPARPPRPLVSKRPRSNVGLEGSPEHCMRPTRHYTVFLCEDSSGDELSQDDDSISTFPDHFLLSTPFEWPQPYRSLKEAEFVEEGEEVVAKCFQGNTVPPSPVQEKFSELSLLEGSFSSPQREPLHSLHTKTNMHTSLSTARSLEELHLICEPNKQQTNVSYQFSGDERTWTLPALKHSSYTKLCKGPDMPVVSGQESSRWDRPLSVPPLEPPETRPLSQESSALGAEGSITIPRPQGRKTPEPGAVLSPAVTLLQGLRQGEKEVSMGVGRKEFRHALNMSPLPQPRPPNTGAGPDLLSLLDPLSGAEDPSKSAVQSQPALGSFHTPLSLNPFTQHPHYPLQRHYSPVVPGNPFSSNYTPAHTTAYFHTPPNPLSVFGHPSPTSGPQISGVWPVSRAPPTSSSSSSLSSLLDSPAPLSLTLPSTHPTDATNDPFSDLLSMASKPIVTSTPPKKKVEDLRRRWETFD